jgi:hypothetical protein
MMQVVQGIPGSRRRRVVIAIILMMLRKKSASLQCLHSKSLLYSDSKRKKQKAGSFSLTSRSDGLFILAITKMIRALSHFAAVFSVARISPLSSVYKVLRTVKVERARK